MATAIETHLFVFRGKNRKGEKIDGEVRADNLAGAKARLRKQGIIPTSVKKKPKPIYSPSKKIVPADIAIFIRQLATMMKAGVPLVQSFDIVINGSHKPLMKKLIYESRDDVSAGGGIANAMRKHRRQFDDRLCSRGEYGEPACARETRLDRVATYREKREERKAKVKTEMASAM